MGKLPVSPLAPAEFPSLPAIAGVELSALECGVRYKGRRDVTLMRFAPDTSVAGVLTRSRMPGAPVDWCRSILHNGNARALIVNAGNSNVFTGNAGKDAVKQTVKAVASALGCLEEHVYASSTGVIGEPLLYTRITDNIPALVEGLSPASWRDAAETICTTDTFPKMATRQVMIEETPVTINGIAKGSGMVAPDMATMLAFIATDANISPLVLQHLLSESNQSTFNAVTVDGDTSTSDMVLLFATKQAGHREIKNISDAELSSFKDALHSLMHELAMLVVRDGEGATKFVTINVSGAESADSARIIGFAIANSPLVKTAIAGEDANWGRIIMAVGKCGEPANRDKLSIAFGDIAVADNGSRNPGYNEAEVSAYMKQSEITIHVDVGVGDGHYTIWTCDLTHGYISINADYRS